MLSYLAQSQDRLETKVTTVDASVQELKVKIHELHTELIHIATTIKDIAVANQVIVKKEEKTS